MSVNAESKYHIGSNPFKNFPVYSEKVAYQAILSARKGVTGLSRESSNLSNASASEKPRLTGVRTQLMTDLSLTVKESLRHLEVADDKKMKHPPVMPQLERERTFTTVTSVTPRSIKFLKSNGSLENHDYFDNSALHYKEDSCENWLESKRQDARDVLYRNTYSLADRKLRYRISLLPRISQERPWTVGDPKGLKSRKTKERKRKVGDIHVTPLQKIGNGFLNITSLSKVQKETENSTNDVFHLRRINLTTDSQTKTQKSSVVHQPSDFGTHPEHKNYKRVERPLKYENVRYKPVSKTNKSSHIIRIPTAYVKRDYKSADAYKEYLKTASQRGNREQSAERKDSSMSQYGYENRVLQSVIDVNQPECVTDVPAVGENKNQDNKSIIIEIKSSWKNEPTDEHKNGLEPETGRKCPVNSPDPTDEDVHVMR